MAPDLVCPYPPRGITLPYSCLCRDARTRVGEVDPGEDRSLRGARGVLGRRVPPADARARAAPLVRAHAPAPGLLDRVFRGPGLLRALDDGPALCDDRALPAHGGPLRDRRCLPLPPPDLRGRPAPHPRSPSDPVRRGAGDPAAPEPHNRPLAGAGGPGRDPGGRSRPPPVVL